MAVDLGDGIGIRDTDVVGLNTDELSKLLMRFVDSEEAFPTATLVKKPEVGPSGGKGCRDVANSPVTKVGKQVEEDR